MHRLILIPLALCVVGLLFAACSGGDGNGDVDGRSGSEDSDDSGPRLLSGDCRFVLGGVSAGVDPASILGAGGEGDFSAVAETWQAIADRAPGEIRAEMQIFVDALVQMAEILQDIDFTDLAALADPENLEKLESLDEVLDTERLDQASDAIEQWFEENCAA